MAYDKPDQKNLAETIVENLPKPEKLATFLDGGGEVQHFAVPKGFDLKSIDNEKLLAGPRRAVGTASLGDDESFLSYVNNHATSSTAAWCAFRPDQGQLSFIAALDDHILGFPAWRDHKATFTPSLSHEWKLWTSRSGVKMSQVDFAEFVENNQNDIVGGDGLPSSLDMMSMAKNFEANADKSFKSKVNTQSGGVELVFVDTDNAETQSRMKLFAQFQIAVPVFWTLPQAEVPVVAYPLRARLKYSTSGKQLTFWYELIRSDLVHQQASLALIAKVKNSLDTVPLYMGAFSS
jgi:uncharacterized protein YfdQ (DUF2303 family)